MDTTNVLFVDDEESLIRAFEKLAKQNGQSYGLARTGLEAIEYLTRKTVDVALVDLNLPGFSGLQILDYIKTNGLPTEIILMTGRASIETAIEALKKGAYDYLTKPFDDIERVSRIIDKALEKVTLLKKIHSLESHGAGDQFLDMIGKSDKMHEVFHLIENVAASTSSVLLLGESGTGKELVAKAIHAKSRRSSGPFMVINCAALPETLLESELFGYQKGSFTGAYADKKGLFEEANGGTVFLDEIGDIPPQVQVKLLRVLQDREVRRIGGVDSIHVDVRLLSATNRDLYQQVRKHGFREDLFYRLNVITITLPPLRERRVDIPMLAYHFLKKFSERTTSVNGDPWQITLDALQTLQEYNWPGNVRELENVMERAVVLAKDHSISSRELPPNLLGEFFYLPERKDEKDYLHLAYREAKEKALNLFNRTYISGILRDTGGNISLASERAGMDRSNFKKIVRKCDLSLNDFKKKGPHP